VILHEEVCQLLVKTRQDLYFWPILMARYSMLANVGSLFIRSPSHGHSLKTRQDRPTISTEHYIQVDTTDTVVAFRSSPICSVSRYSGFK